jgi:ElaB/YqjD/DUF883 family membrane-anchored ribosome-binding protein
MGRNIEGEVDTFKEDIAKLRTDFASLKDAFQEIASERVRSTLSDAQQKIDEWTETARARSRNSLEDLAEEIEDRPLTSILAAFCAGVILGRLFDR